MRLLQILLLLVRVAAASRKKSKPWPESFNAATAKEDLFLAALSDTAYDRKDKMEFPEEQGFLSGFLDDNEVIASEERWFILKRESERKLFIVFRGTQDFHDTYDDVWNFSKNVGTEKAGRWVHAGFWHLFDETFDKKLKSALERCKGWGRDFEVFVTGHSLGGARAVLFALEVAAKVELLKDRKMTVVTFAAPPPYKPREGHQVPVREGMRLRIYEMKFDPVPNLHKRWLKNLRHPAHDATEFYVMKKVQRRHCPSIRWIDHEKRPLKESERKAFEESEGSEWYLKNFKIRERKLYPISLYRVARTPTRRKRRSGKETSKPRRLHEIMGSHHSLDVYRDALFNVLIENNVCPESKERKGSFLGSNALAGIVAVIWILS